jgi:DNA-binding response OmpR family regulator
MRAIHRPVVLVIEDDEALRELYRYGLSNSGYHVVAVPDGVDALRRIDEGLVPQAVVLDLALPRLHGSDVFRELRSHATTRHVPVIVVTGTDTRSLEDPGAFAFVFRKPVSTETLARAIDAASH